MLLRQATFLLILLSLLNPLQFGFHCKYPMVKVLLGVINDLINAKHKGLLSHASCSLTSLQYLTLLPNIL